MMKIALLADGSSIHTKKWILGLQLNTTCQIDLIHLNPDPVRPDVIELIGSARVHNLAPPSIRESGGNFQYLYKVPAIRRLLRQLRPDVIHTIYITSYGLLGALCKGRTPLVHFAIGTDILVTPKRNWIYHWLTRWTLARAGLVMCVSEAVAEQVTGPLGLSSERILTQHYGIEPWVFESPRSPTPKYTFISNRAWVMNSNIPRIGEVLRDFPTEPAAVVGSVARGNESLGAKILGALRGQNQITVFSALPYEKNIALVAESRFLLSWTESDGTPTSVLEAMAVGTIPIVSDISANRVWVQSGLNGFLVPLDSRQGIHAVLRKALSLSASEREVMVERNRKIVAEKGTLKTNMGRLLERSRALKVSDGSEPQNGTM